MHTIRGRSPLTRTPNKGVVLLAAAVLLTALGGLVAGGEWRWLAVPACLFLGVIIFWALSGWRQAEVQLNETNRHLLDLVDFPTQSPYLCTADGHALYTGAGFEEWTGLDGEAVAKGRWLQAVHDDERDAVKRAWSEALKRGTAYDREFRVLFRDGEYRWVRSRAYPSRDEEGRITRWVGILENIHDRRSAEEQLRQTASLLEMIGSSAHSIIYAKDREGRMLYGNRALETLTGLTLADLLGKTDVEWNPNTDQALALQAADRMVLATGQTQDLEEVFTGRDGVARHYQSIKSPLLDAAGKVIGVVGVSSDVSAAREAEQREKLLCRELDHRAKNMLAVVQSVVTLTRADTLDEFKKAVEGRIQSLGRAHSMLAASRWEGADLHRLLEEELAPYRSKERAQLILWGPTLLLKPAAAQSLALVIHELATNAVKYGSLSVTSGKVEVRWVVDRGTAPAPRLCLSWTEHGGPPVAPRTADCRSGFGSRLIRSSVERQLGGTLKLDWAPSGLVATMELALDRSVGTGVDLTPSEENASPRAEGTAKAA